MPESGSYCRGLARTYALHAMPGSLQIESVIFPSQHTVQLPAHTRQPFGHSGDSHLLMFLQMSLGSATLREWPTRKCRRGAATDAACV